MLFQSSEFVCFILVVLLVLFALKRPAGQKLWLLAASLVFYSWDTPEYLWLLAYSTILDFNVGRKVHEATGAARKRWLWVSIIGNIGSTTSLS